MACRSSSGRKDMMTLMKKKLVCLTLAAMMALAVCSGAALAYCQPEAASVMAAGDVLYCHGKGRHGGHQGGHGHHGKGETCDWLFHGCGDCWDVNCTDEDHDHQCAADCTNEDHHHYSVCRYADGTLELVRQKKA